MQALKNDGSVSESDDEHAQSELRTARAAAQAEARKLDLARNQAKYTVLQASIGGVVTSVRFEVGQVVAAGQAVVAIANEGKPEIVVDVPEDDLGSVQDAPAIARPSRVRLMMVFDVVLRELSAQAALQTRTYRARLMPATRDQLPLGATATLIAERVATRIRSVGRGDPGERADAERGEAGGVGRASRRRADRTAPSS